MAAAQRERRILIAEPRDFSRRALDALSAAGRIDLVAIAPEDLERAFSEYDVVWIRLGLRVTEKTLGSHPRCRFLVCPATGLDHIDLEACKNREIALVSLRGETGFLRNVRATAELSLALALALVRRIPSAARSVLEGRWDRDQFRGRELFEKTAGIVGVGRLGTLVAGYFQALGVRVIGFDPRPDFPRGIQRVETLDEVFARADVVSLHVSYDASTHHLVSERQLSLLKPTSVLVNTSRGGVIDSNALLGALRSGRIAGAALDVIEGEPEIGRGHALVEYALGHDNLIIVPHIGGSTVESLEKAELFAAEKLLAALAGAA